MNAVPPLPAPDSREWRIWLDGYGRGFESGHAAGYLEGRDALADAMGILRPLVHTAAKRDPIWFGPDTPDIWSEDYLEQAAS